MRILPIVSLNIYNNTPYSYSLRESAISECEEPDTFTCSDQISSRGTSAGNPLKRLKKSRCAYFDVELLSGKEMDRIEKLLENTTTIKEVVSILRKYRKNMLPIEKAMFKRFEEYSKTNPNDSLPECLRRWYDTAITRLKLEEFNVLDDVDKISLALSPKNALAVHSKTTRCRQVILENNREDTFKRKTLLDSLDEIVPSKRDAKVFELLKDKAVYLPSSSTSQNAFIVKYAYRSHQEVAKRIIKPSFETIEHIKLNCEGGENDIANFVLTSAGANNLRANMPFVKFITMFPKVPKNLQKYILRFIARIHKGQLKGQEAYPYKVRKTLLRESKGLVNLDLSSYRYSESEAKDLEKEKYNKYKRAD